MDELWRQMVRFAADEGGGGDEGSDEPAEPEDKQPPEPKDQASGEDEDKDPVPYPRFKEVIEQKNEFEQRLAKLEEQRKKEEEEQLKEQNKWKELAEKREQELESERMRNLRLKIAQQHDIPAELAERLRGENEEELEQDAQRLLELMKPAEGPGVPRGGNDRKKREVDLSSMSPAEIREWRKESS